MNDLELLQIDLSNKELLTSELAWLYRIIPSTISSTEYQFYADVEFCGADKVNELEIFFGRKVKLLPVKSDSISRSLSKHYLKKSHQENASATTISLETSSKDFLLNLFLEARSLNSSDIHIEVYQQKCRIRLRIDGKLAERILVDKAEYPSVINKIKIMAGLDISEKRLPQDGRIFFDQPGLKLDVRVSVLPTLYGEKIVLRLLGTSAKDVDLEQLGFSSLDLQRYREAIRKPSGIILISGPTGSGKTTSLYGTLKILNKITDNILTIEDPIEYTMEGINQVQVKEEIGLTFSNALRSFLRQDPDIIMVGEIRDAETASLAIRAALTGHLVLSTIHTNSAWGTISRLIDMGVPSFLLANTLNVTVAQRLVRLLCTNCKLEEQWGSSNVVSQLRLSNAPVNHHSIAKGCQHCFYTGYKGRKAIYEVIPIDMVAADFILQNTREVDDHFRNQKIKSLKESALELVYQGETSIEEIYPLLLNDQY
jgi:type IV pilus assembly protein PilB